MACSLEVRAPFLDHELVEFVMGLPSRWKLKGLTSKYLVKKAMKNVIPEQVLQRKKKGFGVPIAKWIKGPLKQLSSDLVDPSRSNGKASSIRTMSVLSLKTICSIEGTIENSSGPFSSGNSGPTDIIPPLELQPQALRTKD